MPAKKKSARGAAKAESADATYDVASLPLDDTAAAGSSSISPSLSQTSSLPPSQKRAKKEAPLQNSAASTAATTPPDGSAAGASSSASATATAVAALRTNVTTAASAAAAPPEQPILGDAVEASLAESTLRSLLEGAAPAAAADAVLTVYRSGDTAQALCAVLNVVAKASGVAEVELDANALVDGVEVRPLLEELYSRVPEDSEAYLLVNKDAKYRFFRRTFPEWCATLVHDAFASDILLDATFLPVLSQWLIAMSESKSRAFRHTATVALLAVVQALSGIAADLQSQLALLRAKKDIAAVQRRRDDVVEWRDHLFSQAVHQRLRDVAPDIRLAGFQALRGWILDFPDEFMTNKYLRYLGMPLHDKRPELRAEALDTILQALAHVPDAYSRMHLFLQYFMARLVELSGDVDVRCTELAIRVVAMVVRGDSDVAEGSELLSNETIDRVLLTLFDERPTVRAAAGILLKVFIHCRTAGEESEAEQVKVATELLCSFAATLRTQYGEAMPEKYLIDALWTPERPPVLLTAYEPMLAAAQSDKPLDAVVGLQLLAALLSKLQGTLTLGPLPKDDRRGGTTAGLNKKVPLKAKEEATALQRRLSEDAALALCTILEVHRGSEDVLQAAALLCAALDMTTFTSQRHHTALSALLIELRKATLLSPCVLTETRECLVKAWHQLAFTDYPLRTEAQAHLQELLKNVVSHFTRATKKREAGQEALAVWGRMHLVSSLVATEQHWTALFAALQGELTAPLPTSSPVALASTATLVMLMTETAANSLLWQVKAVQDMGTGEAAALEELRQRMKDVVTATLQYQAGVEEAVSQTDNPDSVFSAEVEQGLVPVTEVFIVLCDLLALPYYDLSQVQQELLVRVVRSLHAQASLKLSEAKLALKVRTQASRQLSAPPGNVSLIPESVAAVVGARRLCSRLEALQLRLVSSVARLFLFKRLDSSALAAPFLVLWTQTPSKAVSDTFKSLFHTLRDRAGGSDGDSGFGLERDIVMAAYNSCAEDGATLASTERLYQTGLKLASLHFVGSDRYYPCCPAMVRFGADFATSTDPLVLQAIAPYASKLRPVDALHVLRDQLSRSDVFAEATNPYVRTLVTALRKAAKLEEPSGSATGAGGNAGKRRRALDVAATAAEEETMLDAIAQALPEGSAGSTATAATGSRASAGGRAGGSRGQRISVASRVVTADGWHVPATTAGLGADVEQEVPTNNNNDTHNSISTPEEDLIEVQRSQGDIARRVPQQQHHSSESGMRSHRSIVNVPSMEEMALSSQADELDSGEVFVATEEFDE